MSSISRSLLRISLPTEPRRVPASSLRTFARPFVAIILTTILPSQLLPAQAPKSPAPTTQALVSAAPIAANNSARAVPLKLDGKLDPDQRILHLLSRFTFGPTPDDIAAVKALDPNPSRSIVLWFEQQLHPDRLPDPQLTARMADYPALQLPVPQLIQRFPSGAEIREAANGKRVVPRNSAMASIYRRHIALYEDKQAKKAEEKAKAPDANAGNSKPGNPKSPDAKPDPAMTSAKADMAAVKVPDMAMAGMAPTAASAPPVAMDTAKPQKPAEPAQPTPGDLLVKTILALPPADRVNRIMAMEQDEYEMFRSSLKGPLKAQLTADMNPNQRELLSDFDNPSRTVIEELQDQRLLRDIYSSHQLQEVMTTFWLNHFNVYLHKNEEAPYYLVSYERDVIRPRALGNFESLLVATAQSPAMLQYLDNSSSTGPDSMAAHNFVKPMFGKENKTPPGLNENYARELMELHTLGVNGGYTQHDVTEVAKIFTGWTVEKPQQGGGAEFDLSRHQPGKKIVMGHKFKENGQKEGLALLHMLATSPATAHFISQELAVTFVSDNPPPALTDRMAQVFLRTHGDISSVLRIMLHSPEFWTPQAYQGKVKTPLEYVVSAARASGAQITDPRPLVNALNQMGMPLYACVPPTGYSWKADAWVSTGELVTRMNFALSLATNHYGGVKPDWSTVVPQPATPVEVEQTLEARIVPSGISDRTRAAVLNQAQSQPAPQPQARIFPPPTDAVAVAARAKITAAQDKQNAQIAGLLLGSPEFQRR